MTRQVAFYRDTLGLPVKEPKGVTDWSKVYWVELDTGSCTLVLHGGGKRNFGEDAPKIVFAVQDITAVRRTLMTRGVELSEVRSPAPNVWVCDGLDPEGNKLSLEERHASH
jgi:predicted enzyme related to lactoylglutathione lyase